MFINYSTLSKLPSLARTPWTPRKKQFYHQIFWFWEESRPKSFQKLFCLDICFVVWDERSWSFF